MKFLVYSGSARKGNFTQHVAAFVQTVIAKREGIEVELVTPQSLGISFNDEGPQAVSEEFSQKVADADGYILVAPEYNHGYSGSLKYMLDLCLKEYIHKPVAFVGVSMGPWGGTRVIEALVTTVREMGMVATFTDTNVTMVQDEIENGTFKDAEKWEKRINRSLDELIWMAETLKAGRDKSAG
jgi:NAD(P)H-dependent FMN reductase